mgnify:FL=1
MILFRYYSIILSLNNTTAEIAAKGDKFIMQYTTDKIRNICLLGHGGDGKSALAEALLYFTGSTDRLGTAAQGNTVSDFDPEEIKRQISISTSVIPVEWKGKKINLLDTPGYFDFEGEVLQAVRMAETALVVVSAKGGIHFGTTKAINLAKSLNMPQLFFITSIDEEHSDFYGVFDALKQRYGKGVCAISVPIIENEKVTGYVDIVEMKGKRIVNNKVEIIDIPASLQEEIDMLRQLLIESVAEADDDLMEKFFADEPFTDEEIIRGLSHGIAGRKVFPVLCGSSATLFGMGILLDFIDKFTSAPKLDPNGETELYTFKTVADPFVGKLSYFKVLQGTLKAGDTLHNPRKDTDEKFARIFTVKGKAQTEVKELVAGDIGVVAKLASVATGDTLGAADVVVPPVEYPVPNLKMSVFAVAKGEEEKIASGLAKLREEDPTFTYKTDPETKESVISALGDTQIDVIMSKLKAKYGVSVDLRTPKVAYRETIRKTVTQQGKYKKQSGGHGQYGDVHIRFEPYDGIDLVFGEEIFGGSVPKNFHPAVEKGLRESAQKGVLAGYPVVGLKATLVDGSYHDVDSSEMSFKLAAGVAYKEGLPKASPVILEPIGKLLVHVPDRMMGDIIGDITKRRGQIIGMTPIGDEGYQEIEAEVPMAEMMTYAIDLRSMTRGRGTFTFDFLRYADAPANVAEKVIADAKAKEE